MTIRNNAKIKKKVGRERETTETVSRVLRNKVESWGSYGHKEKYFLLFKTILQNKPISFLEKRFSNTNIKPQVMFLGPGKGGYIPVFNSVLYSKKITPEIDVFALTRNLSEEAKRIVRKDFSSNDTKIPFERLNTKTRTKKVKELQEAFLHKYDLIMAPLSVGFHTLYPANALFTTALMLKKRGKAYVQISDQFAQQYLFTRSPPMKKHFEMLNNLPQIFQRFVEAHNKRNNTKLKYTLKKIENSKDIKKSIFFEITRTS